MYLTEVLRYHVSNAGGRLKCTTENVTPMYTTTVPTQPELLTAGDFKEAKKHVKNLQAQ